MGRLAGAFFVPTLSAVVAVALWYLPRIDPRRESYEAFRPFYDWFVNALLAFLAYTHELVLAINIGCSVPINRAIAPALGALYYGTGILMAHAEPNWFAGVRTPWTLEDDAVWEATHRRAALALKLAGTVALGAVVWPSSFLAFAVVPVLAAAAYAVGYSYLAYRRRTDETAT